MKRLVILIMAVICCCLLFAAPIYNMPLTLTQPDGTKFTCYTSGDEYFHWLHDSEGYIIIQDSQTGYYCYAGLSLENKYENTKIFANSIIDIESKSTFTKKIIPPKAAKELYNMMNSDRKSKESSSISKNRNICDTSTSLFTNIVIFVSFADDTTFNNTKYYYDRLFNRRGYTDPLTEPISLEDYFLEVSYQQLQIHSYFYPISSTGVVLSYHSSHTRNYYQPKSATNNEGYANNLIRRNREINLVKDAINYISPQVPSNLIVDHNNDGIVDNVCIMINGGEDEWNELLWPHKTYLPNVLPYNAAKINGIRVSHYNLQLEDFITNEGGLRVLCHEMNHTLGVPDYYHSNNDNCDPVDEWDIMEGNNEMTPKHMCAYTKFKYNNWINSIAEITTEGTYTLNPLTSSTNNCYKINIPNSDEFLILEYRRKTGKYESTLSNSGLVIYRINENYEGNYNGSGYGGVSDEVYVFRQGGTLSSKGYLSDAPFSIDYDRREFHKHTDPQLFLSNGNITPIVISNISSCEQTISFNVCFCANDSIEYSNTNNLPANTIAKYVISTDGNVIVEDGDNVIFESGGEIILSDGFQVQSGGTFLAQPGTCIVNEY